MSYRDKYTVKENTLGRCPKGKVCLTKKNAQTKKNYLEKLGTEDYLRIYQCEVCNWWHLTSREDWFPK